MLIHQFRQKTKFLLHRDVINQLHNQILQRVAFPLLHRLLLEKLPILVAYETIQILHGLDSMSLVVWNLNILVDLDLKLFNDVFQVLFDHFGPPDLLFVYLVSCLVLEFEKTFLLHAQELLIDSQLVEG